MRESKNLIVCLGNFNNLAWFTCYNLANSTGLHSVMVLRPFFKLRDEPLLKHENIKIFRSPLQNGDELKAILAKALFGSDKFLLFILSGSNIRFSKLIRLSYPGSIIIYYPIGFELESVLDGDDSRVLDSFIEFASVADYVLYQDQGSARVVSLLNRFGGKDKALPYSRMIHVLRPNFIKALIDQYPPSSLLIKTFELIPKNNATIFWASRITSESADRETMNNKGFRRFALDLIQHAENEWCEVSISLLVINRDNVSSCEIDWIRGLLMQRGILNLNVIVLPELNYPEFCYAMSRVGLVIDTYSTSGTLRVNMTTADAISVGATVSSSFDSTLHSSLLLDRNLRALGSSEVFRDSSQMGFLSEAEAIQMRLSRCDYIRDHYFYNSELAESGFLEKLLS